jgi:hypothetical protein
MRGLSLVRCPFSVRIEDLYGNITTCGNVYRNTILPLSVLAASVTFLVVFLCLDLCLSDIVLFSNILKQLPRSSTKRRVNLADKIDSLGSEMPVAYSECRKHKRICRVHTSSSRCNNCNRYNSMYDVRLTELE